MDFLRSDDLKDADKAEAAQAVNEALAAGWVGMPIAQQVSLEEIATAHERVESARRRGRVVLTISR